MSGFDSPKPTDASIKDGPKSSAMKPVPKPASYGDLSDVTIALTPIRATLVGSNRCEALGATGRGSTPVLALCRALVAAGHDPRRPLHAYRGDVLALKVRSIGEGARLTVREDRAGPRFVAWEPFPRRVGAWVCEKAEGIGSAPDQADEPSASPGAAVRASAKSLPDAHSGTRRRPR